MDNLKNFISSKMAISLIMTPKNDFVYFSSRNTSKFDILPNKEKNGSVKKYYDSKENSYKTITTEEIVSSDTPIYALIELFVDIGRNFYFVNKHSDIVGVVHYSDLNKIPAKLIFYLLIADLESVFSCIIKKYDNHPEKLLPKEQLKKIEARIKRDEKVSLDLDIFEYFSFSNFLTILSKLEILSKISSSKRQFEKKYSGLCNFRNKIAHSNRKLISSKNDLRKIKEKCEEILELKEKLQRL